MTAVRTQATRAPQREPAITRRKNPRNRDRFSFDKSIIPRGMDWQWNVVTVLNEAQRDNQIDMREAGWRAVTWRDLPDHMRPVDLTEAGLDEPVVYRGQMLMQRPMSLTIEARAEDLDAAQDAVRSKQRQLQQPEQGGAPRKGLQINRNYERPQPTPQQDMGAEGPEIE